MNSESSDTFTKQYEVRQIDGEGALLSSIHVQAESSAAAAKELRDVEAHAQCIEITLDGIPMNQMTVNYWRTRVRKR